MRFAGCLDVAAVHTGGVEGHHNVAVVIERDETTVSAGGSEFVDYFPGGVFEVHAPVLHVGRDIECNQSAHEEFAHTGARNAARFVVGIGARSYNGRIPDPAPSLVGETTR